MQPEKRKFPILAVIAVVLCVLAAGMLFLVLAPGPRMHWALTMGEKYLTQGNYEQAVTMFTRAIQVDDRAEAAYLGRAEAYTQLGESEAAEADLTFVIDELGTDDAQVYLTRAAVYDALQQPEKAQADRDTAQEMGADVPETDTTDTAAEAAPTPEPTATLEPTKTFSLPTKVTYYSGGQPTSSDTWQYDSNGLPLGYDEHQNRTESDGQPITNRYDSDGKLISATRPDSINGGFAEETYTYDDHGNLASFITTQESPNPKESYYQYTYDAQGRVTHLVFTFNNGTSMVVGADSTYTYESDHFTMETYCYIYEPYHSYTTYTLDGRPLNLTSIMDFDDEFMEPWTMVAEYTYDANGLCQSHVTTSSYSNMDDDVHTRLYTYTYDENGNVLSRKETDNGTLWSEVEYQVFTFPADYKFTGDWLNECRALIEPTISAADCETFPLLY